MAEKTLALFSNLHLMCDFCFEKELGGRFKGKHLQRWTEIGVFWGGKQDGGCQKFRAVLLLLLHKTWSCSLPALQMSFWWHNTAFLSYLWWFALEKYDVGVVWMVVNLSWRENHFHFSEKKTCPPPDNEITLRSVWGIDHNSVLKILQEPNSC